MKQIIWIVLIAALSLMPAMAGDKISGYAEVEAKMHDGETTFKADVLLSGQFTEKIGWYAWGLKTKTWGEAYVGPTFKPVKWFKVGVAAGVEECSADPRYGSFIWMGTKRFSTLGIYARGSSSEFHKSITSYKVNQHLKVGVMTQVGLGVGPRIDISYKRLGLYATTLRSGSEHTELLGLLVRF